MPRKSLKSAFILIFIGLFLLIYLKSNNFEINSKAITFIIDYNTSIFEQRQKRVKTFCDLKQNQNFWYQNEAEHLFVLKERNLVWCPIYKAGSSTWMNLMIDLSTKSKEVKTQIKREKFVWITKIQGRKVAPELTQMGWKFWQFQNWVKNENEISFMVVRHPFDRLVSAFRDKLERIPPQNGHLYFNEYGQEIVKKFRSEYLEKFGNKSLNKANHFGAILPVKYRDSIYLPTFWEFIQWLLKSKKSRENEHWAPMTDYCFICSINYDYFIKFENYAQEGIEFMQRSHLDTFLPDLSVFSTKINLNRPNTLSR